ncbi:restriction endonuclease subunit S [Enterobacter asburiae]
MGEVCLIPEGIDCCLGQRQVLLRANSEIDPYYLFWALQSPYVQHQISWNEGTGTTVSNVRIPVLKDLKIPRLGEHESWIAKTMTSLALKSQINEKINQTLEQMAQALFKSWFVDFEPVKTKMAVLEEGGSQEDATLAAMTAISGKDADALAVFEREHPEQYAELKATAELFPSAMQESELGEIPIDWDIKNIKSMSVALSKGTTPAKKDLSSEENQNINFLKVKDIGDDGRINFSNLDKISKRVHEMVLKRSVLQCNDILFSIAGTIGRVAVVKSDMLACNCNQAIAFIRLKNCASHLNLVRLNLQSPRIQQEVESKVVQGVQANLSLTALGELEVVLPSDCVLIAFNNVITPIWEQKLSITKSIMLLTQLRDTLLPKLLSGEITLPEAEQAVSEAENV